jgi:endonuclease-3
MAEKKSNPAKNLILRNPPKLSGKESIAKARPAARLERTPERVAEILRRLDAAYPGADCALKHRNAWELLVATILSAQCTDVRVNMVTPVLFDLFPTPQSLAVAKLEAIEQVIRSTGFYRNKAKNIQGAAQTILRDFGGKVPKTMAELLTVPGAARKTANVVLGVAYKRAEGIVVDTHVFRIARRLGLTKATTPEKVEQDLIKIIPQERWIRISHELILHGRAVCDARRPKCSECSLADLCKAKDKTV